MSGIVQTYRKQEKEQNDSKKKQLDHDFPADQIILDQQQQILSIRKIKSNLSQPEVQKTVPNLNQKSSSRLVKPTRIQLGKIENIAFQSFHNQRPTQINMDNFYTERFLKITDGDRHRPIEHKKQDVCFSSQDFQFGEYMILEIDYHKRIQKHLTDFSNQLFALQTQITSNDKFFNAQRILKRAQNVYQTNQFIFQRQSLKTKQLEKQLFKQYGQVQQKLSPFSNQIQKVAQLQKQQQDLNKKYQSALQKLILTQREQSQAQKSTAQHLFQISIIKFQQSTTLYRYGAKVSFQAFNKEDVFNPNLVKWDAPVKGLQIMDLKIFVLNALYPLVGEIFNEFPSLSNVYKVMFNQCSKLSNIDIESAFGLLKGKIQRFLVQKKFSNLGEFFKNNGKNRRRKIIVISSQTKFKQILNEVTKYLQGIRNQLINLLNINFQFNNKRYEDSCFQHHKMIIEFEYQKMNFSTTIDLLHSSCEKITKLQIQNIRRKTYKTEPALVWFEIPKFASKEKINDYKLTHLLLKKCHFFSTQMERQYQTKRYI